MLSEDEIKGYLDIALVASLRAGDTLKHFWGKLKEVSEKAIPGDLVTEADKQSEVEIIRILQHHCPSHSILAEESGLHQEKEQTLLWTIDPLDGTTNYAHQFPYIAVSIALLYQGTPVVGVVYNPIMKELFTTGRGIGAFLNGQRLHVSLTNTLNSSLLATGFAYNRRETADNNYHEFAHLTNLSQGVRRAGAASLDLAYVAAGKLDGYWEQGIKPWDISAGALLVEEAGGRVSSYDTTPLDYMSPKILASNGNIHKALSQEICKKNFS